MRVLALDPATTTGWAFFDGVSISEVGHRTFETMLVHEGARLNAAYRWLKDMIALWKPDLVVAEGFFASGRFSNGSNVNHEIRGVFKAAAFGSSEAVPYKVTGPSEWKKQLCGRTTPTKSEKKLYGKEKAKKMVTVLKLQELGFSFPEKVKSAKGNMVKWKFDTSDAIGILVAELQLQNIPYKISPDLFQETNVPLQE